MVCAQSPTKVDNSGVEDRLEQVSAQIQQVVAQLEQANAQDVPPYPVTLDYDAFVHPENDGTAHFVGNLFNYGEHDLKVKPVVTYQDSAGLHIVTGKIYHFENRGHPYFEISTLKPGMEAYWDAVSSDPIDKNLLGFEVEFRQI